ncbi:hypothetical protein [Fibrisoma montanum]|nr:hypothetical protein [Fibrisoma montanum]
MTRIATAERLVQQQIDAWSRQAAKALAAPSSFSGYRTFRIS